MSFRIATLAGALIAFGLTAASAGDYADREILGFSPDGKYFAFEEYGVGDASGFPYANIYVLDTLADSWVPGTPIRVNPESEEPTLEATRAEAGAKAKPVIDRLAIGTPGVHVVSNPLEELSADPHRAKFLIERTVPLSNQGPELTLNEFPLGRPDCPDYGTSYDGFDLTLKLPEEDRIHVLHRDTTVPGSRGCAYDYAISDVFTFIESYPRVMVVLISVYSVGFEGPDRRFIAVSSALDLLP